MAVIFLIIVGTSAYTWDDFTLSELPLIILIAAPLSIAAMCVSFFLCLLFILFNASEKTGLGRHHYELLDDGLKETTELNEEYSKWSNFDRVWKSRRLIILKRQWAALHIFPKRCFASPEHYKEFHAAIAERVHAANRKPT